MVARRVERLQLKDDISMHCLILNIKRSIQTRSLGALSDQFSKDVGLRWRTPQ